MNLKDLNYIVEVNKHRSFIKAAQTCFVSQPTLSTQIKKLEDHLGIQVFERSNKKVLITPIGEQIIAHAQTILDQVDKMQLLAKNHQDPLAGQLRIGAFPSLASHLFPSVVTAIKTALPKIQLILVEEKTDILINQLEKGDIDAAFLSLPIKSPSLISESLFDDEFELAVSNEHPLANKTTISPHQLIDQQLLLLDEGHCMRDQALQFCQWSGAKEQLGVRAASLETLRQMVIAGTGVTLMPAIAIDKTNPNINYIPFQQPAPKRTIGLVWRKSTVRGKIMQELIDLLRKARIST